MKETRSRPYLRPLHPLHGILLAFPIALFSTGLASDIAYLKTAEMQWSNFASWAIAGALVFSAPIVAFAALGLVWHRRPRAMLYFGLVAVMWIAGLINAFQHSHDAWSSVGTLGLLLSILTTVLALVASWIAFSYGRSREIVR